jgi:hypothetical protein
MAGCCCGSVEFGGIIDEWQWEDVELGALIEVKGRVSRGKKGGPNIYAKLSHLRSLYNWVGNTEYPHSTPQSIFLSKFWILTSSRLSSLAPPLCCWPRSQIKVRQSLIGSNLSIHWKASFGQDRNMIKKIFRRSDPESSIICPHVSVCRYRIRLNRLPSRTS